MKINMYTKDWKKLSNKYGFHFYVWIWILKNIKHDSWYLGVYDLVGRIEKSNSKGVLEGGKCGLIPQEGSQVLERHCPLYGCLNKI